MQVCRINVYHIKTQLRKVNSSHQGVKANPAKGKRHYADLSSFCRHLQRLLYPCQSSQCNKCKHSYSNTTYIFLSLKAEVLSSAKQISTAWEGLRAPGKFQTGKNKPFRTSLEVIENAPFYICMESNID